MTAETPISDDLLALRLRALGHPARLAILRALAMRDTCLCGEIVRGLPLAQSTVSQHLKILKEAGLIAGTVEGPRSCYGLDRATLAALGAELSALFAGLSGPVIAPVLVLDTPAGCNPPMPSQAVSAPAGCLESASDHPISTAPAGELPDGS